MTPTQFLDHVSSEPASWPTRKVKKLDMLHLASLSGAEDWEPVSPPCLNPPPLYVYSGGVRAPQDIHFLVSETRFAGTSFRTK